MATLSQVSLEVPTVKNTGKSHPRLLLLKMFFHLSSSCQFSCLFDQIELVTEVFCSIILRSNLNLN